MRFAPVIALLVLSLLPLAAQESGGAASVRARVYVGMVVEDRVASQAGLKVLAVAPGSPAFKAGVRPGDMVLRLGERPVTDRNMLRRVVREGRCGQSVPVEVLRRGQRLILPIVLAPRPDSLSRRGIVASPLGADRHMQPIALPEAIRQKMRRHRRVLREQLASLPDGLEPSRVTRELQAIRDLARDAHAGRPGWMSGRAGEISVRFRDAEGSVVLYGADNKLQLEFFGLDGLPETRFDINTPAERRALPEHVLERLRRFR